MTNLTTYSRHPQDEPVLQQLETYLQHLSTDNKATMPGTAGAAIAIAALYQATDPRFAYFNYIYNRYPKLNKSIALLPDLSLVGFLALARAILEELAVLEQLRGVIK